ncbi:MAG TPA: F0F1 ATP synthase subunit delta, partial [Aestuariivirga sp.]|nr:F0F1 ATP synthase subunit delta [Aestuariivirga sp.]
MASTDQTVSGVAGRYANALFELAREEKSIDRVAKDLATVQAHLEGSDDLQRLFTQPSFRAEDQGAVVADLGKKMGLSALTGNFLQTLA